jgi:hypothetical protein
MLAKKNNQVAILKQKLINAKNEIKVLKNECKKLNTRLKAKSKTKYTFGIQISPQKCLFNKASKNAKSKKITQLKTAVEALFAPIKALNKINTDEERLAGIF